MKEAMFVSGMEGFRLCTLVFDLRRRVPSQMMPEPTRPIASAAPSPEFIQAFCAAAGPERILPFDRFMALARTTGRRLLSQEPSARGYGRGTDFYTASNVRLFGELIIAPAKPCSSGLAQDVDIRRDRSGTRQSVLKDLTHPF